jgi:16S rRNA (guanine966-N2)-methyltransferase
MRVVTGRFGGRRIRAPEAPGVRPTSDRVREALFAWLGALEGVRVLDVYAGSGAIGIEALSRGASSVTFIERGAASLAALRDNLRTLGIGQTEARVLRGDAVATLRRLGRQAARFDLVFLDPPYASGEAERALVALVDARLLTPEGTVVLEAAWRHPVAAVPGLQAIEERRYGDTVLLRFTAAAPGAERVPGAPGLVPEGGPSDA